MIKSLLAISVGASAGAILRWGLGNALNGLLPGVPLPPGTLVANLLGGYLIGVAVAVFSQHAGLAPEWRLLIITGFVRGHASKSFIHSSGQRISDIQRCWEN